MNNNDERDYEEEAANRRLITDPDPETFQPVPWWAPDPGAVNDVNPICGHHINARCPNCRCCMDCDGCYCDED